MALYRRGETWWLDLALHGSRIRRSTGTSDRAEAQRQHDALAAEARRWKGAAGGTLADALKLWLTARPRTRNERNAIKAFLAAYPNRPLAHISGHDLADALADKSPATANRTLGILRAALRLAWQRGLIPGVPPIPRGHAPAPTMRFLTRAEWGRLEAELPAHLKPVARLAVLTGLRARNLTGLTWDRVDIERGLLWIDAHQAKGRRDLHIPLSAEAAACLAEVKRSAPISQNFVFSYRGRPISGQLSTAAWRKACARAGLAGLRFHDLRHTWASWHAQAGTPLAVLRELGGWADIQMVQRYAKLAPSHLAAWAGNVTCCTVPPESAAAEDAKKRSKINSAPVAQWIELPPPKAQAFRKPLKNKAA